MISVSSGASAPGPGSRLDAPPPGRLRRDLDRIASATWTSGPEAAVDRMLAGKGRTEGVPADFAATADLLGDSAAGAGDADRLQAWWLYRMLFTPDPLAERLTLVWHNHFATSQLKVDDVAAMKRQNDTFRRHARAVRQPAAGDAPRPGLARLARCAGEPEGQAEREPRPRADGAVHARGRPLLRARRQGGCPGTDRPDHRSRAIHVLKRESRRWDQDDPGRKTDRFDGDTLADLLLDQPATSHRLAWRLCQAFLGENVAGDAAIAGAWPSDCDATGSTSAGASRPS